MLGLSEQVILVTGATSGLGRHVVDDLVSSGATVVAHGRDPAKIDQLRAELVSRVGPDRIRTAQADFDDLRQVDQLADDLVDRIDRLHLLVNNAGIGFGLDGSPRETSRQGIERRFAVNYLAGYHLTRRLVPLLVSSAPARVVNVASIGQEALDFDDLLMTETRYSGRAAYRRSKLAQVMFTFDLADELRDRGVTVNALHPATFMDTAMVREAGGTPLSTVAEGGTATLRLITWPDLDGVTGEFFDGTRPSRAQAQAYDADARRHLRELSDRLVQAALAPGDQAASPD